MQLTYIMHREYQIHTQNLMLNYKYKIQLSKQKRHRAEQNGLVREIFNMYNGIAFHKKGLLTNKERIAVWVYWWWNRSNVSWTNSRWMKVIKQRNRVPLVQNIMNLTNKYDVDEYKAIATPPNNYLRTYSSYVRLEPHLLPAAQWAAGSWTHSKMLIFLAMWGSQTASTGIFHNRSHKTFICERLHWTRTIK